jgi:opacity protein-like surface antigen
MTFRKLLALAVLALAPLTAIYAAGATGKWTATFDTQVGQQQYTWDLTADGTKLTGKYTSSNGNGEIVDGKINGDELSWVENLKFQDMDLRIEYKAKLTGDQLKLTRKVADVATEEATAKRAS